MQLRRFLTGLTAAAVVALFGVPVTATTRIAAGGLDQVLLKSGVNSVVCFAGKVVSATPVDATNPNTGKSLPAIEYTINCSKILKGNNVIPASEQPKTIKLKMYAGIMKDFPRPVVGETITCTAYGNSAFGLTSFAFGDEGLFVHKEVDGVPVVVSAAGKGLYFKNKNLEAKFLKINPAASKFLRKAPAIEGLMDSAQVASEEDPTPEALESAIKTVLTSAQGE